MVVKKKDTLISQLEHQLQQKKAEIEGQHQAEAEKLQRELKEKQKELEILNEQQVQQLGEAGQEIIEGVFPTLVERLRAIERNDALTDRKKDNRIAAEIKEAIPFFSYLNRHDAIKSIQLVWGEPCRNAGLDLDKIIQESHDLDHTQFGPLLLTAPSQESEVIDAEFTVTGQEKEKSPTDNNLYIKNSTILKFLVPDIGQHNSARQAFRGTLNRKFSNKVHKVNFKDYRFSVEYAREYISALIEEHGSGRWKKSYFQIPSERKIEQFLGESALTLDSKCLTPASKNNLSEQSGKMPVADFVRLVFNKNSSDYTRKQASDYLEEQGLLNICGEGKGKRRYLPLENIAQAYVAIERTFTHPDALCGMTLPDLQQTISDIGYEQPPAPRPKKVPAKKWKSSEKKPSPKKASAKDVKIVTMPTIINYVVGQGYTQPEAIKMIEQAEKARMLGHPIRTGPLEPVGYDQYRVTNFYSTIHKKT